MISLISVMLIYTNSSDDLYDLDRSLVAQYLQLIYRSLFVGVFFPPTSPEYGATILHSHY